MVKHYNINVFGTVQGVFYRAKSKEKADELGIFGFVKNADDGSVYIEAEGQENSLKEFMKWCFIGPEKADVKSVEVEEGDIKGYNTFEIQRIYNN